MEYYDREEDRRRRELRQAEMKEAEAAAKLAELRRQARSARSRLLSTTRHETWHAHRLAAQDRQAGYDGEMSEARHYVRSRTAKDYVAVISPFARAMPDAPVVEVEVAAVRANLDAWTERGKALLYERARIAYATECRSFESWATDHPGEKDWRERPATRPQWMLIRRTVEALHLNDMPSRLNCGEAYDWLQSYGANVRFRPSREEEPASPSAPVAPTAPVPTPEPPASDAGMTNDSFTAGDAS